MPVNENALLFIKALVRRKIRESNMAKFETGEFSVCQFFTDGSYEYVRRYVSAHEAMNAFKHYTESVASNVGMVQRVIITDGGDCINAEWIYGKGITFPLEVTFRRKPEEK